MYYIFNHFDTKNKILIFIEKKQIKMVTENVRK